MREKEREREREGETHKYAQQCGDCQERGVGGGGGGY